MCSSNIPNKSVAVPHFVNMTVTTHFKNVNKSTFYVSAFCTGISFFSVVPSFIIVKYLDIC